MINDKPSSIGLTRVTTVTTAPARPASAPVTETVAPGNVSEPQPKATTPAEEVKTSPVKVAEKEAAEAKTVTEPEISKARMEELKERVNQAIPRVRELMQKNQRSLDFEVAEEQNRVIITVIDRETDKVIRQIPPEDLLQIAHSIDQGLEALKGGAIFNSKA